MTLAHLFFSDKPDIRWDLCAQMGVRAAVAKLAPELTGRAPVWDFESLKMAKGHFEDRGFSLVALEGDQFDMTRIKLGLPGWKDDVRLYCRMLENMGRLGIRTLCYNFMYTGWTRTRTDIRARGGALVTGFSRAEAVLLPPSPHAPVDGERIWKNYERFIAEVIPAAEHAGVRMALHPDDPPVEVLQGIARTFICPEAIDRALSLNSSGCHGLTFCQGTFATMGADLKEYFLRWRGRIPFIHIRDVAGTAEDFRETFPDEGPSDIPGMLAFYKGCGFDGIVRSDHTPAMAGDCNSTPGYNATGAVFGTGYLMGIMDALKTGR